MSMLGLIAGTALAAGSVVAAPPSSADADSCSGNAVIVERVARLRGAEAQQASIELGRVVLATPGLPRAARAPFLQRGRDFGTLRIVSRQVVCSTADSNKNLVVDPPDLPNIPLDPNAGVGTTMVYSSCDPFTQHTATYHLRFVRDKDGNPATKDPGWIVDKVTIERLTAGCPTE